ncbi:PREDICTED: uncharacterized protein LOC105453000 isoform X2 [Wasmannia auropunctata]|nr:PREDICTED: uncharacterized protein LOC105453000 isoform X2 [Wasmannia auropunctata]XP_011692940.1 PREDICTED: uncharacterized protein LOC105453000 isoform X2 [Wasmannia auropunctata]XP_011692942.1 PREDICTED: uncharacterized protein LOC105453000 isoform X2 [Wasmannia auropunctata]
MCKTHDLIKQYSENMKEIERLKTDLEVAKREAKHTITNYTTAMDRIRELELKIVEDKQSNEKLIEEINTYKINIAADEQRIKQLTCKLNNLEAEHFNCSIVKVEQKTNKHTVQQLKSTIKDLKDGLTAKAMEYTLEKSCFEDQIKELKQELERLKAKVENYEKEKKEVSADTAKSSTTSDIGINVSLCDIESSVKPKVRNQYILTDEFYNIKNDPHPLFCAKCEAHLPPELTPEMIFKTMTTYPKLIEKDLSLPPKKIYSPSCSLPSTYPGSINRNEDTLSKVSAPQLSPYSLYSESVVTNLKSQSGRSSAMTQVSESVELRNDNLHLPTNPMSSNVSSVPTMLTLSQNRNCTREDFYSNDLLTKHSSSIKEMERKIRSLEGKMKKFRRLEEKMNSSSHCCSTNHANDISLNSSVISMICKGMAEFYERREAYSKNERDIDSERCTRCTKKTKLKRRQQQSNRCNACENTCSWKINKLDENDRVRDSCCKTKNATKTAGILQSEHASSNVHENNSSSDTSMSLNDDVSLDETEDKEEFVYEQNILHSTEVESVEDSSRSSANEICASDNLLSKDKDDVEDVDIDNQTEVGTVFLSENVTDRPNEKIAINAETSKMRKESESTREDKADEVHANDNIEVLSKANVEDIDMDNQAEVVTIFLPNNENFAEHTYSKTVDINTEKNEIKEQVQDVCEDKVGEIHASDNPLSKNNEATGTNNQTEFEMLLLLNDENFLNHIDAKLLEINAEETIDMDNQTEVGTVLLFDNENSADDGKIGDNDADKIETERKSQSTCNDKISEVHASNKFLDKNNAEAVDSQIETTTILSNNEISIDHSYSISTNINAEKNKIKGQNQDTLKDKIDEIHASDDLGKNNVKVIDTNNQTEIGMTALSNDENSVDHTEIVNVAEEATDMDNRTENGTVFLSNENSTEGKVADNKAVKNEIKRKGQNTHEDEVGKINTSDNSTNDIKIVDNNDKIEIKRKGQNTHKDEAGKLNTSDNLSSKDNTEAMDDQTETESIESLSNDRDSTDQAVGKIIVLNAEKRRKRGQGIQKGKVGDRILKKLRSLKRKTQASPCVNKQKNVESYLNSSVEYELTKKPRIENEDKISSKMKQDYGPLEQIKILKRNLDTQAEPVNKQGDNNHYEPTKKLRIAHTPKTSVDQSSTIKSDFTHSMIRNIATLAIRRIDSGKQQLNKKNNLTEIKKIVTRNKCDEKSVVNSIETNNIDIRPVRRPPQNNDTTSSAVEHVFEFGKSDNVSTEGTNNRSVSVDRVIETSNDEPSVLHNDTANDTTNNSEIEESILLRTRVVTRSKDSKGNKVSKALERIKTRKETITECTSETLESKNNNQKISKNAISNDESSVLQDRSTVLEVTRNGDRNNSDTLDGPIEVPILRSPSSPRDSGIVVEGCTIDGSMKESLDEVKSAINEREEACVNKETGGIRTIMTRRRSASQRGKEKEFNVISHRDVEESQSRDNSETSDPTYVLRSPSPRNSGIIFEDSKNDNSMKKSVEKTGNSRNEREKTCVYNEAIGVHDVDGELQTPMMSRLVEYINENKKCARRYKRTRREIENAREVADIFIRHQLNRLINSTWENSIHDDVVKKLNNTCGPRIIAKCILEFLLSEEVDHSEPLDNTYTPPAPLMTTFEQKIIALLFDLEVSKPTVIHFVQAAIEYHLCKLSTHSEVKVQIDSLTRIYVNLSRIQKDREKVRMLCCSALYCMGLQSIRVLYTILTCWSEVLPNAEAHKGILPKCVAFLINSYHISDPHTNTLKRLLSKLIALKQLIAKFYNYTFIDETTNDMIKELVTALKAERIDGLDTAIILVAKREGPSSTYKNIIDSTLLPMIIREEHPNVYSTFSLLGRLLRAFPTTDNDNIVQNISEQLRDLIQSGQVSHELQEGIISTLLSISRHNFNIVASSVIKWIPSKPLRPIIDRQLETFLNSRNSKFWKNFLQNEQIGLNQSKA